MLKKWLFIIITYQAWDFVENITHKSATYNDTIFNNNVANLFLLVSLSSPPTPSHPLKCIHAISMLFLSYHPRFMIKVKFQIYKFVSNTYPIYRCITAYMVWICIKFRYNGYLTYPIYSCIGANISYECLSKGNAKFKETP